jgi:hypothetical protein
MQRPPNLIALYIGFFLLVGCMGTTSSTTDGFRSTEGVVTPPFSDGRSSTALEAFRVAEGRVNEWNQQAKLYEIVPTRSMVINLSLPLEPIRDGWFFMFKVAGSPLEYYIAVNHGEIVGTREAQPVYFGESPPYVGRPIDYGTLPVKSTDVLNLFYELGGRQHLEQRAEPQFEYRLVHPEGLSNPVWSLYDFSEPITELIHIDAVTGERVSNPVP